MFCMTEGDGRYFPVDAYDDFAVLSLPWDVSRLYKENVSFYKILYHIFR